MVGSIDVKESVDKSNFGSRPIEKGWHYMTRIKACLGKVSRGEEMEGGSRVGDTVTHQQYRRQCN